MITRGGVAVKASSNGANTDGTSQNIGNALGVRPSIKLLRIGAINNSGAAAKAAIFGVDENELLSQADYHYIPPERRLAVREIRDGTGAVDCAVAATPKMARGLPRTRSHGRHVSR